MKKIATLLLAIATVATATAGGLITNSNQSAAFLRNIARGTTLDTDAVYNNPAGTVFMTDGWHLGINNQMAYQTRSTESTFAPFAMGAQNNGLMTKEYKGEVFSPAIPSFHLTWKKNRWAVMVGMGVNGGGGSLEYDNGLASFERQFSVLPAGVSNLGQAFGLSANQYNMDMYLKGTSMTLAFNAGVAFRVTDWLSIAAQVRFSTTSNAYEGYMKNIQINPTCAALGLNGAMMSAPQFFQAVGAQLGAVNPQLAAAAAQYAALTSDHILDVEQKGTSISPVVAIYAQKNGWAFAAKYEGKMGTELEIESAEVSAKDPVINGIFADGSKVKAETPALLSVALSRQFGKVKVTAEWHEYFDKDAKNSFSNCVEGNTMEYLVGAEWQISKKWLVSCGVQRTQYDLNEAAYSDMNFSTPSWSTGIGAAYSFNEKIRLNLGIMPTFYEDVTSEGVDSNGINFKDVYSRTSLTWGVGLDFKF